MPGYSIVHLCWQDRPWSVHLGASAADFLLDRAVSAGTARQLIVAPLLDRSSAPDDLIGSSGRVLYNGATDQTGGQLGTELARLESEFHCPVVFGRLTLRDVSGAVLAPVDLLLLDVAHANRHYTDICKFKLYDRFGIRSSNFEQDERYEFAVRFGEPALAAVLGLLRPGAGRRLAVIAHHCLALPAALMLACHGDASIRCVYRPGMTSGSRHAAGRSDEALLHDAGHTLERAACRLEQIWLPSEREHAGFRSSHAEAGAGRVRVVPARVHVEDGAPAGAVPDHAAARGRLVGQLRRWGLPEVDVVLAGFSAWPGRARDGFAELNVLAAADGALAAAGRRAVLLLVASRRGQMPAAAVGRASAWGWPLGHRELAVDLLGDEALLHAAVQVHNLRSLATRVVLVNQVVLRGDTLGLLGEPGLRPLDIYAGPDGVLHPTADPALHHARLAWRLGTPVLLCETAGEGLRWVVGASDRGAPLDLPWEVGASPSWPEADEAADLSGALEGLMA